jgi:hypothetical protein
MKLTATFVKTRALRRFVPRPRREEGSAIMFALLAMIFLTIIGLSLTVVTETEMLIGTNEQLSEETFYAAEAGVATAVSQLLVTNDLKKKYFAIPARDADGAVRKVGNRTLGYSVDFSDVYPVAFDVAPYSTTNEGSSEEHYHGYFYVKVRARRLTWPENQAVPDCATEAAKSPDNPDPGDFAAIQAEKVLNVGFYAGPLPDLGADALWESFYKPDAFGCSPEKDDDDYVQKI